jgi:hypothetical protein
VIKSKEKYNKVLPVHIIEKLVPVTDNPSALEDPYGELSSACWLPTAAPNGRNWTPCSASPRWGTTSGHQWSWRSTTPSSRSPWKSSSWPSSFRVLPNRYCEHFSRCQFKSAEELADLADGLWEKRGSNLAIWATLPSPGQHQLLARHQQQQQGGNGGGGNCRGHNTALEGATVAALAAATVPPLQGGSYGTMAALAPMVAAAAAVAASMMTATWEQGSVSTTTPTAANLPDASHNASSLRETGRPAAATEAVVTGGRGG